LGVRGGGIPMPVWGVRRRRRRFLWIVTSGRRLGVRTHCYGHVGEVSCFPLIIDRLPAFFGSSFLFSLSGLHGTTGWDGTGQDGIDADEDDGRVRVKFRVLVISISAFHEFWFGLCCMHACGWVWGLSMDVMDDDGRGRRGFLFLILFYAFLPFTLHLLIWLM
jgi:hypothetical protein